MCELSYCVDSDNEVDTQLSEINSLVELFPFDSYTFNQGRK